MLLQSFLQSLTDAFAHFSSGSIGKGHYQQLVDGDLLCWISDHGYDALHEDGCFAGTRCCGD